MISARSSGCHPVTSSAPARSKTGRWSSSNSWRLNAMRPVSSDGDAVHRARADSAIVSSGSNMVSSIHPAATRFGVAMAACGVRALTVTPSAKHSLAAATVSRFRAAFDAPYWKPPVAGLLVGNGGPGGSSAANEVRLRIQPPPRDRMPPTTWVISSQGAQRLTWRHRSRSAGRVCSNGRYPFTAALLTRMSIGPSSASVCATSSRRPPSGTDRSAGSTRHVPPFASIRRLVSSNPSTDRAVIATRAPSAASRTAMAVPVPPWLAPVTRATRPAQRAPRMSCPPTRPPCARRHTIAI